MTSYCKQCSEDAGNDGWRVAAAGQTAAVLCDGCGLTLVDSEGNCVRPDCALHGAEQGLATG
jgi:hypothetical protein